MPRWELRISARVRGYPNPTANQMGSERLSVFGVQS
jgi:hypothetical protein